jgi:hypothetical protein
MINGLGKASTVSMEGGGLHRSHCNTKVLERRDATCASREMIGLRIVALLLGCHRLSR